ncbi:MAG TPA: helix-turn-helix domain-containing protein [Steroidobacteraceae bacterium]|jgi:hypothetical protein
MAKRKKKSKPAKSRKKRKPAPPRRARKAPARKAAAKEAAPVGRPTKYLPQFLDKAAALYIGGATDLEVADALGVSRSTLYNWQQEHPEFLDVAAVSKKAADDRVERSYYNRAVGYTYDAVKIFNAEGFPLIVPYREHVPPDVGAAFNWLKNRKKEEWRDVKQLEGKIELATLLAAVDQKEAEQNGGNP